MVINLTRLTTIYRLQITVNFAPDLLLRFGGGFLHKTCFRREKCVSKGHVVMCGHKA